MMIADFLIRGRCAARVYISLNTMVSRIVDLDFQNRTRVERRAFPMKVMINKKGSSFELPTEKGQRILRSLSLF